jgi:hypothetical protein
VAKIIISIRLTQFQLLTGRTEMEKKYYAISITLVFFALTFFFCEDTISNVWSLEPANGGVGTWSGDTVINSKLYKTVSILGTTGINGKADYETKTSVNNKPIFEEAGTWEIDATSHSIIRFTPEYSVKIDTIDQKRTPEQPVRNTWSASIVTDSTMSYILLNPFTKIPIRLQ